MTRLLLVLGFLLAACGDDSSRKIADAKIPDGPSGSNAVTLMEPHPHDSKLDILVAGLSIGVIVGPAIGARRRRRDAI